ncbi:MAG: 3-oxoadipate enol-lactonase, partial [Acetobacteraceae bacterium]|nr:3-oxoadipate enol-lactonase [Acetobacteraceae bacterium]
MIQTTDAAGQTLSFDDTGPGDAPAILLLHSLGTSAVVWDPIVPALIAAGYRVIRPDMRGHGHTSATRGPYSIDLLARDALAIVQGLGLGRFAVVGLSIGGLIAQQLAHLAPDHVSALVLMDTALAIPPASLWAERAAMVRADGMAAVVDGVLARWLTPAAPAHTVEALRRLILTTEPEGYAACCEAIATADLTAQSGGLAVPTLVIVGADDPSTPVASAEALARTIPAARLEIVPDASHIPTAEQPAAVAGALLRFLL